LKLNFNYVPDLIIRTHKLAQLFEYLRNIEAQITSVQSDIQKKNTIDLEPMTKTIRDSSLRDFGYHFAAMKLMDYHQESAISLLEAITDKFNVEMYLTINCKIASYYLNKKASQLDERLSDLRSAVRSVIIIAMFDRNTIDSATHHLKEKTIYTYLQVDENNVNTDFTDVELPDV
jgi:hypothetical protein